MKKLLAVSVLLNAVLVLGLGLLWRDGAVQAEGGQGAGTPSGNGDVNGDEKLDLSDAVYTLQHLFMGGPAPVPIECPPPCEGTLPATGQTACYDTDGAVINCASASYPGQDGFYKAGRPSAGRFIDNQDGTVTDTCTGLMWQRDTADANEDGAIGVEDRLNWQAALHYCESLSFAGHDDWRLPNLRELQSIVDYGRFNPVIDPVFGAVSEWYWSSSKFADAPDYAWLVDFLEGQDHGCQGGCVRVVRAVRSGL